MGHCQLKNNWMNSSWKSLVQHVCFTHRKMKNLHFSKMVKSHSESSQIYPTETTESLQRRISFICYGLLSFDVKKSLIMLQPAEHQLIFSSKLKNFPLHMQTIYACIGNGHKVFFPTNRSRLWRVDAKGQTIYQTFYMFFRWQNLGRRILSSCIFLFQKRDWSPWRWTESS